jgi:hypothetical protein
VTTLCAQPTLLPSPAPRRLTRAPSREGRLGLVLLVTLCIFDALLSRLCYLVRPFDSDGAMFIYMGRLVSEGGRLGNDLVDNKFPTVGLITSVAWRAFGANWSAYVLTGATLSLLGSFMLARIGARHIGSFAVLPAMLFSLVYFNLTFAVFGGFQLETIQAFFAILAAGAGVELLREHDWRDALTCGLCGGIAAMLKPTGLAVIGAVGAVACAGIVARRWSWRDTASSVMGIAAGLSIPAIIVLIYLIRTDTLRQMPALWRQIARYAASSAWEPSDWTKPLTILLIVGFPILVRGWIFRRAGDRLQLQVDRTMLTFALAWLVLETIGVAMQRRMYAYHFLVLAPPATLLFALLPRGPRAASLTAALVPVALFSLYGASLIIEICYTGRDRSPVSEYIARHTTSADAVWKDDAARLWLETGCRPGSRFPMTFLFANYDEAPIEYVAMMIADFERTKPKYIVLPVDRRRMVNHQCDHIVELARFPRRRENFQAAWETIGDYVDQRYVLEARLANDAVYRRR